MKETNLPATFCYSPLQNKFNRFVQPLKDCFGLDVMMLTKVAPDGSFYQLCSREEIVEYYWTTDFYLSNPFFHHPKFYRSGSLVIADCTSDEFHATQNEMHKLYNAKCVMVNFIKEGQEVYWIGFGTRDKSLPLTTLFLNERPLLERYSRYLLDAWKPYFGQMEAYTFNIAKEIGEAKFRGGFSSVHSPTLEQRKQFLKTIGVLDTEDVNFALSTREEECLSLLLLGHSAPQIAKLLSLSSRTVEHYIINIKHKLHCKNKAELIEKALELREFGLL